MPHSDSDDEICFGIVLDDMEEAVRRVAETILKTRLHTLYMDPVHCGTVHAFGERLGLVLTNSTVDGRRLTHEEEAAIRHLRGSYAFRAEHDPRVTIHMSGDLNGWTVICEEEPLFALSSGPRHLYIKPVPESFAEALLYVRPQLQGVLVWPFHDDETARFRSMLGEIEVGSL